MMFSLSYFLSLALVTVLLFFLFKYQKWCSSVSTIPGPPYLPLIGNALEFSSARDILPKFMEYKEKYGRIFRLFMGNEIFIVVSDRTALHKLFENSKNLDKGGFFNFFDKWTREGLATSKSEKWKVRRKILNPAFHHQILEKSIAIFDKFSEILVRKLTEDVGKPSVNIQKKVFRFGMDVICETSMGFTINAQESQQSQYLDSYSELCGVIMSNAFSITGRIPLLYYLTQNYKKEKKCLEVIHGLSKKVIETRRKEKAANSTIQTDDEVGSKKKQALLDILLEATVDGKPLSDIDIQEEVDTFIFAGHDTTATAINFLLYNLANNPNVQTRITRELEEIFSGDYSRTITYKDLAEMKYLEMAIKESMRLMNVAPLVARTLDDDEEIDGIKYPKGAVIILFFHGCHTDEEYFPKPNQFDPERFSKDNISSNSGAYFPFGVGVRNCIGQKFAMMTIKTAAAKILLNYELSPAEPKHEIILSSEVVMTAVNGVRFSLQRRRN